MRKLWIDTDCCCDDCMAIIMAMYDPDVEVTGISVVTGYRPASDVWKNPFITCQEAGVKHPPVYKGADPAIGLVLNIPEVHVHGEDGIGDLGIELEEEPVVGQEYAPVAILNEIKKYPGELEIVALGPLTNSGLAYLLDPDTFSKIKKIWYVGGVGAGLGNISTIIDSNTGGDPEAAKIVFTSGVPIAVILFEPGYGDAMYSKQDLADLAATGRAGTFIARANHDLADIIPDDGALFQIDPVGMGVVLWPDIVTKKNDAFCDVEFRGIYTAGMLIEDTVHADRFNCEVIHTIDATVFKKRALEYFAKNAK